MPHRVVRPSGSDRSRSLGWLALAWIEYFVVHGPGDVQGEPIQHGDEFSGFVVDCYALDDRGRRLIDSAFFSRPKGCDKSGLAARLALFEALGPCRFADWAKGGEVYTDPWGLGFEYIYEAGEPMGRPVNVPYVRCMATEETQVGLVFDSIYFNLTEGLLADIPGIDSGLTRVNLPGGGQITPSTASGASKDGGKETFCVLDESHLMKTPELRRMYETVTRNLKKRKRSAEPWYIETTTMYAAGENSVAEATYDLAGLIESGQESGKPKVRRERLLVDHRWGECDDLADEEALRAAVVDAYGEALGWNDVDGIVDEFYDPRKDPVDSRRYFLNAKSSAADAWMDEPEWAARRVDVHVEIGPREPITLGFDGSRRRDDDITDATALIGCRVKDGHMFQLGVWEQPKGPAGKGWEVPKTQVDAAVAAAFQRYRVVAFYADPAKWETSVAQWEAKFGPQLIVKSMQKHPIEWWMTGERGRYTVEAVRLFREAVLAGDMTHDGAHEFTTHVLNARRRVGKFGVSLHKENPHSSRKIDAAIAAILAYKARLDALANPTLAAVQRRNSVGRVKVR